MKGKGIVIAGLIVGALFVCVSCVILLLHKRNVGVVEDVGYSMSIETETTLAEESAIAIESTQFEELPEVPVLPTKEQVMFSANLSDYIGKVVVSTYMDTYYVDAAIAAIEELINDNSAVYLYTVTFSRDSDNIELSYYLYDGDFKSDTVLLEDKVPGIEVEVVYEEYQGQITVMR